MNNYIGARLTVNGVLDEKIEVTFNDKDGAIGLVFVGEGANDTNVEARITYAAANKLVKALNVALTMRKEQP
jgi:hypothetical protein